LMAFLPLIFWDDIMGEFMKFLPITLIITLSCSLFVALVFNPVIASVFLRIDPNIDKLLGDRLLRRLTGYYEQTLGWTLRNRWKSLGAAAFGFLMMTVIWVVFTLSEYGVELFPSIQPNQIFVEVEAPLGTRLETSDAIVRQVEKRIQQTTDMEDYVVNVGNVQNMFDFGTSGGASHKSQVTIDLLKSYERSQNSFITMEAVGDAIRGIPGATVDVSKPDEGPPTGKPVEIRIKGQDFNVLARISEDIMSKIEDVPNITKLKDNYDKGKPELRVRIDREKAALFELNTSMIANTVRTAINGTEASEYRVGTDEYDITVRFSKDFRQNYNDLLNLTVFHEGVHYPLANFASIELASGMSSINHVDGDRVVTITAESLGKNPAEVLEACKQRLTNYRLPAGYTMTFAGQNEEQQKSMDFLSNAFMIAIFLIFFL
ncbi:MAG: efflux RND transporter permease subunit, partial [Calditrichaeota bacterium]|nr:efflux RND transporter permease subunit [Calditrichota bacterium]